MKRKRGPISDAERKLAKGWARLVVMASPTTQREMRLIIKSYQLQNRSDAIRMLIHREAVAIQERRRTAA